MTARNSIETHLIVVENVEFIDVNGASYTLIQMMRRKKMTNIQLVLVALEFKYNFYDSISFRNSNKEIMIASRHLLHIGDDTVLHELSKYIFELLDIEEIRRN